MHTLGRATPQNRVAGSNLVRDPELNAQLVSNNNQTR